MHAPVRRWPESSSGAVLNVNASLVHVIVRDCECMHTSVRKRLEGSSGAVLRACACSGCWMPSDRDGMLGLARLRLRCCPGCEFTPNLNNMKKW